MAKRTSAHAVKDYNRTEFRQHIVIPALYARLHFHASQQLDAPLYPKQVMTDALDAYKRAMPLAITTVCKDALRRETYRMIKNQINQKMGYIGEHQLIPGQRLWRDEQGVHYTAVVDDEGMIQIDQIPGKRFASPSAAAKTILGYRPNGWTWWHYDVQGRDSHIRLFYNVPRLDHPEYGSAFVHTLWIPIKDLDKIVHKLSRNGDKTHEVRDRLTGLIQAKLAGDVQETSEEELLYLVDKGVA